MTNVKISSKGRALLKNRALSTAVVKAVVTGGNKLYSQQGITFEFHGKKVTVKGSGSVSK
jgi:hypothetical protein